MADTELFTLEELASYLQRDLDTATATLTRTIATATVRSAARHQQILRGTTTALEIPGWTPCLRLPQRPVIVTELLPLALVGDEHGTYTADEYERHGHKLTLTSGGLWDEYVTVTYSHGFDTVPGDIKGVALAVAGRIYDNPKGLRSVSIDDYSETRAGSDTDLVAGVSVMPSEQQVLDRYFGGGVGMVAFG